MFDKISFVIDYPTLTYKELKRAFALLLFVVFSNIITVFLITNTECFDMHVEYCHNMLKNQRFLANQKSAIS